MTKDFEYDFGGYATRNNIKCSDGQTICKDAFKDNDQDIVPLVWNHQHGDVTNVLGHALLENRADGVYAYCSLNNTEKGKIAKEQVKHGDIEALSIYANHLKRNGSDVIHGAIREVSLVLAGANPGAYIDSIMLHSEYSDEDAIIYSGDNIELYHAEEKTNNNVNEVTDKPTKNDGNEVTDKQTTAKSMQEVLDTLTSEQKKAVYGLIGLIGEKYGIKPDTENNDEEDDNEEDKDMKHNLFDNEEQNDVLAHADTTAIFADAKRYGSLRDSALAHGIDDIEYLFPDAQSIDNAPDFIKREDTWVSDVMNGVHHTPFSRIKSMHANITEDDARAKGYIKGHLKKDEVFGLLKRTITRNRNSIEMTLSILHHLA